MHAYGVLAQAQVACDDLVGLARAQQAQHVELARSQLWRQLRWRRLLAGIGEAGQSCKGQADGLPDILAARGFGQKAVRAAGAGAGLAHGARCFAGRYQHDACAAKSLAQWLQAVQSVHAGQLDVQQQQVYVAPRQRAGLGYGACLADGSNAGAVLHYQAQAGAEQRVIVDQQQVGGHACEYGSKRSARA